MRKFKANPLFIICVVLAVLLFLSLTRSTRTEAQTASNSRFLLFQGEYDASLGDSVIPQKGVFRIDTQTGATWTYVTGVANGKFIERWNKVSEP